MKDEFKRAQHQGKHSYDPWEDGDKPNKGKARERLKRDARKALEEHETDQDKKIANSNT